jgi:hypothetical protein
MDSPTYKAFKGYLKNGRFPRKFPSTKSNFVRESKKYSLNKKGVLLRKNLIVVKKGERKRIFEEMHHHSGNS